MRRQLLVFTLLTLPTGLSAKTLEPNVSQIQAVTVFLDRAEVTRQVNIDLPAGSHAVLIPNLPARLLIDSLRIRGEGNDKLRLGSVESRRVYSTELTQQKEQQLTLALQSLQDEKAALDGRRQALDTQATFIERLAKHSGGKEQENHPLLAPEKWPAAWQAIGSGMAETNKARHALMQQLREIEVKISKTEQELNQIRSGRRDSISALINLESERAQRVQLSISYQVPGASWSPVYDAQLHTEQARLELGQAAYVRQSTGESWDGVSLTVSTARPSAGATMPELQTWWLDFPRPVLLESRAKREIKAADEMLAGAVMAPAPQEAEESVAQLAGSDFAVSYRIPGKASVGSDNTPQRFALSKQEFPVQLSARTAPRLDPRAFLYAEFDYESGAPLLPGPWRLVRDGQFVGEVTQPALRPGAHTALAFGNDDGIDVNYQVLKNERGERGVFSKDQRIERRYRIDITNRHRTPLQVSVYDQVPVARDEQIKVSLSPDSTPPTERDPEGRVGVLTWRQELKPQAKQSVMFGYSVSYPQGRELPGF